MNRLTIILNNYDVKNTSEVDLRDKAIIILTSTLELRAGRC